MKKLSIICLIIGILLCITGCDFSVLEAEASKPSEEVIGLYFGLDDISHNNIESYTYEGDVIYVPVSYQHIKDGTMYGLDIIHYVNLNTGVMYVYTEKFKSGYGTTWCELRNPDGTLVIYEKLDELREKHSWG